jgi:SAM-dependent methyltransferase
MKDAHPADALDAPATTAARRDIIARKRLLHAFYDTAYEWFSSRSTTLPTGRKIELGSGAGHIKETMPDVQTSDIMPLPFVDMVVDATAQPFGDGTLSAIYMIDTLHHIPDVSRFLSEAERTLAPGGRIIMQEPANSTFGRFIYRNFHHEAFEPSATRWSFPSTGPLSSANGALPWIVFERDRAVFKQRHPTLRLVELEYCHPLLYLASGGFSARQMLPDCATKPLLALEKLLRPLNRRIGMFVRIVVEKQG